MNSETYKVTRGEIDLKLGPTEFRLLKTFMEKPGRVWSREELLDRIWGRDVYLLRHARLMFISGAFGKNCREMAERISIRTVRGVGYSLG